jgi:hypothetical protein
MTTSNSIKVKARAAFTLCVNLLKGGFARAAAADKALKLLPTAVFIGMSNHTGDPQVVY